MTLLAILTGALSLTVQTEDLKPADLADLQCLALTAYAAALVEEGSMEQAGIATGVTYYLGRLQGRTPDIDWIPRLQRFSEALTPEDLQRIAPRCSGELQHLGEALVAAGEGAVAGGDQ